MKFARRRAQFFVWLLFPDWQLFILGSFLLAMALHFSLNCECLLLKLKRSAVKNYTISAPARASLISPMCFHSPESSSHRCCCCCYMRSLFRLFNVPSRPTVNQSVRRSEVNKRKGRELKRITRQLIFGQDFLEHQFATCLRKCSNKISAKTSPDSTSSKTLCFWQIF